MVDVIIENRKFKAYEDIEFYPKTDETDSDYNNRIDAMYECTTHWLCKESIMAHSVTENKVYVFVKDESNGEYNIINDDNEACMAWIFVDGDLLEFVSEDPHLQRL